MIRQKKKTMRRLYLRQIQFFKSVIWQYLEKKKRWTLFKTINLAKNRSIHVETGWFKKKIDETSKSKVNMIYSFLSLEFHMRHYNDNNCLYRIYLLLKKRQH